MIIHFIWKTKQCRVCYATYRTSWGLLASYLQTIELSRRTCYSVAHRRMVCTAISKLLSLEMSAGHSFSIQEVVQVNHLNLFKTTTVIFCPRNGDTEIARQDVILMDDAFIIDKKWLWVEMANLRKKYSYGTGCEVPANDIVFRKHNGSISGRLKALTMFNSVPGCVW